METKDYKRKNRIEQALSIKGLKQVDLCEKCNFKKSSVNGWIKQNWQPKQDSLFKMAQVLDVSEMWLAGYDVPMDRKKENVGRPDIILKYDDHTYSIEVKRSKLDCKKIDRKKIRDLFEYILDLEPDQLATIESMVNQLHKLNKKGDNNE